MNSVRIILQSITVKLGYHIYEPSPGSVIVSAFKIRFINFNASVIFNIQSTF